VSFKPSAAGRRRLNAALDGSLKMMKSLEVLLLPMDEAAFSAALRKRVPDIQFVNDCYWPTQEPPRAASIDACTSKLVYLWSPSIAPVLPSMLHSDGIRYHGPQSGIVVQLIRCVQNESSLRAGTISVGWDDPRMTLFVKSVWQSLRQVAPQPPVCVNPETNEVLNQRAPRFRVGVHATRWCLAASERFFRDNTIRNHYRPLPGRAV
jgi:hypothetical protein